ncbi:MAG: undecaprenyl-phosphate glucose phosphotransferase [Candidatus Omnitrophica bacterium]|nr:undecaprenyl-phosphate glucose phosphotransferase [Candidatus Omnitrophota bacterium]
MIAPKRRKRDTFLPWVQLLTDCIAINLSLTAAFWLRFGSRYFDSLLGEADYPIYHRSFIVVTLIAVFFIRSYGLYKPARLFTFADETMKVCKAVVVSTLVLLALTFFIRSFTFSRTFVTAAGLILAAGISLGRFLLGVLVMAVDQKRGSLRNILVVGCDENARRLARFYRANPRFSTRVVGFLHHGTVGEAEIEGVPVLGEAADLQGFLKSRREIHEVVLSLPGVSEEKVLQILYACEKELVSFRWIADIFGLIASKMSVSYLGGVPVLSFVDSPLGDWENRVLKRGMDVVLSSAALAALSPLFLLLAVSIKRNSPGSVFYRQERVGQDGRRFVLYKFRTMEVHAEKETGPVWAKEGDPRRTRIGAFLRENNLDELPQLWNVLKGDMSLVGPRPERPYFVSRFKEDVPRYMARHSIRSGITGWAQVNGLRGNTSVEERTKYDLYYIENWSLFLDFKILLMTFLARRNAY